ncbi:transglutaminase TgpA family protein [Spirulina major]|uniref:transglutaminase TgpA family protein n=1 Tax=Spirulina major TaxID=270636 RepID=UPI0009330DB8|nr:transglutaminaseTgpA domain-containing protein [Spirulina major]
MQLSSLFRRIPVVGSLPQRLMNLPRPETEESLTLRIFVQVLVVVGIVATDVAASTQMSVWAIPLSFAGTGWSWVRRKHRNITVKFLLAIAMLAALMSFLGNLLANLNDTRLVLAQLLIQLQVLHSFDLPRRKDLGYSMVIGLILIGVAGTLSETLLFGPFIVVFLAIAFPILILDYRSRLGFSGGAIAGFRPHRPANSGTAAPQFRLPLPLSLQQWGGFFALTLLLGLAAFALMPRFPGYQLQTLPVSSSIAFENQRFGADNRGILNPGTADGSAAEGDDASGTEGAAGAEETTLYYGFSRQMDQLGRGKQTLTPKVVMRVRSQAPGFWRVLAFDRYTGSGWDVSRDEQLITVERPDWSYRFYMGIPNGPKLSQQVIQTFTITAPMPNLIPVLTHPQTLYFPTPEIAFDPEGGLRAPIPLTEELTYTAISDVPRRDRTALGQAGTNYPDTIRKYYLQVPPAQLDSLRLNAETLLSEAKTRPENPYEIALFLAQELKQQYSINPDGLAFPGEDLTEMFFRNGGGYPDHFSTVLTLMLRSLGIPARLSAGFGPGQFNPFTGFYVVRNTDAFALTEVYFPDHGWYSFDPLPGHEIIPPSIEEVETFGVLRQFWNWIAGWLPSPVVGAIAVLWSVTVGVAVEVIAALWQVMSNSAIGFLFGSISLAGFGLLVWLVGQQGRRWWQQQRLRTLPPMERIYRQMILLLDAAGDRTALHPPKHPSQTPREYADHLRSHYPPDLCTIIDEITQAYLQWYYGSHSPNTAHLQAQLKRLRPLLRSPSRTPINLGTQS